MLPPRLTAHALDTIAITASASTTTSFVKKSVPQRQALHMQERQAIAGD